MTSLASLEAATLQLEQSSTSGKSSAAAASADHEALYRPGSLSLMLAPSQRQSSELLRKARSLLAVAAPTVELKSDSAQALELSNGSRIVSLPAREDTIRGFSNVALLVFDEAAWVDDDLYVAARPMLAVSGGLLLALSRPPTANEAGSTANGPTVAAGTGQRSPPSSVRASRPPSLPRSGAR